MPEMKSLAWRSMLVLTAMLAGGLSAWYSGAESLISTGPEPGCADSAFASLEQPVVLRAAVTVDSPCAGQE